MKFVIAVAMVCWLTGAQVAVAAGAGVTMLSKATQVESKITGRGAKPSEAFAQYEKLSNDISDVPMDDLMWLKANGTPAARVYAAFLMYKKDRARGEHAFLEFLDDDTPVRYQTGCDVMGASISEIGRSVVATGKFLDFESTAGGDTPIYVQQLIKADSFADGVGGEGGRNLHWLVFDAARRYAELLDKNDLVSLVTKGSPAGKVYGALLQDGSGKFPKHAAMTALMNDTARATYLSGCKGIQTTVGAIAKQLKESGKFYNFKAE